MSAESRVQRWVRSCVAALALGGALGAPVASAQTPNPNEAGLVPEQQATQSKGDVWPAYTAFFVVAALGLFIVCKSARRAYSE